MMLSWQYMKSDETFAGHNVEPPITDTPRNPGDPIGRIKQGQYHPVIRPGQQEFRTFSIFTQARDAQEMRSDEPHHPT